MTRGLVGRYVETYAYADGRLDVRWKGHSLGTPNACRSRKPQARRDRAGKAPAPEIAEGAFRAHEPQLQQLARRIVDEHQQRAWITAVLEPAMLGPSICTSSP
nr:hypothetical protein [Rhizobium laguerreae]